VSFDLSLPLRPPGLGFTVAAREAIAARPICDSSRHGARPDRRVRPAGTLEGWGAAARGHRLGGGAGRSNLLRVRSLTWRAAPRCSSCSSAPGVQDLADRRDVARSELHLIMVESEIVR